MKKPLLLLVLVSLLASCQVGSETALRKSAQVAEAKSTAGARTCDLPKRNSQTGGYFIYESSDVEGCVDDDTRILEMAPIGWHGNSKSDPLMTWKQAQKKLSNLEINGVRGWRLPSGWEVLSSCEYRVRCVGPDYPTTIAEDMASGDSDLPLQLKMEGEVAARSSSWWWTRNSMPDGTTAVVISPNFRRSFASQSETFRVRPIRTVREGKHWINPDWRPDVREIANMTCYQSVGDEAKTVWREACSKFLLCGNWAIRSCIAAVSTVKNSSLGDISVVLNDETIDTYLFDQDSAWNKIQTQSVPWLLDPERIEGATTEIALVDITSDNEPELVIRRGSANFYTAADSMDLVAFRWDSSEGRWIRILFPAPSDPDWVSYTSNGKDRLLRWGAVVDGEVLEEVGYRRFGGHVDDMAYRYRWVDGSFKWIGEKTFAPSCYTIVGGAGGRCYGL
jgi:hypothetical protein